MIASGTGSKTDQERKEIMINEKTLAEVEQEHKGHIKKALIPLICIFGDEVMNALLDYENLTQEEIDRLIKDIDAYRQHLLTFKRMI